MSTFPLPGANWTYLRSFFVLEPSGDQTGTQDTAAINAAILSLPSTGGTVWLGTGQWYVQCGQIVYAQSSLFAPVYLRGAGNWATFVSAVGSGDLIRMFGATPNRHLGGVLDMTLDGANTTGASTGIHIGDGILAKIDCAITNFSQTGSIGLHLDNTQSWAEQFRVTARLENCASHVVFDVTGTGFNSFARTDLNAYINASAGQDGVVVQNGAVPYNSALSIRGNFASSSSAISNAVLRITGAAPGGDPNATGSSQIRTSRLEIGAESATGAFTAQTINFGNLGPNGIFGCYGFMDFSVNNSPFVKTNYVATNANTFNYFGPVTGDTNLSPGNTNGVYSPLSSVALQYNKSNFNGGSGNFFPASGDFFTPTITANITVTFQGPFIAGPQRKTIVATQGSAGGFTITWPHNASPTTSAPKIVWAGGTAPVLTATANAVDIYKLETVDGATWYGQAIQNVS